MSNLLARYADAIFWLARYVERAEDVARILDVNETFSRDSRGDQNWRSVLQIYADQPRFFAAHEEATAEAVIHFYTLDASNPASILNDIGQARSNARMLRPLISTEMWTQLNIFYNRLRQMSSREVAEPRLSRFCGFVKENCQAHTGITEGTFYRDEGWHFYRLGRAVERADQTTRLLDVKYHLLLPSVEHVGSPLDVSQWNALLRSAAAYHAFRRMHPSGMTAADVAGFLIFHRTFPRSIAANVDAIEANIADLRRRYELENGAAALERIQAVRRSLDNETISDIIRRGLHEYLDGLQQELNAVSRELGEAFFGHAPRHPAA
ncbi:Uncharacterized conserved protein, Alpha-E superfamily [Limimonas halophila]|uniref:Uncharacterized conserved protein, Alpha-E superfamily n=1 Tax=Limimonas halophila TaxID=1082479 RepID=A0A1G7P0A8_9PROT|nr:alpha-E domain-containing protein [Limimonas halophila]SDF79671.1 Uncharacterized conserved protein, Alpha-E superfamily [Limimonas halophila]